MNPPADAGITYLYKFIEVNMAAIILIVSPEDVFVKCILPFVGCNLRIYLAKLIFCQLP